MAQVKSGDTVKVHYTGKLDDGGTFFTSTGSEPLQLIIGDERMIPAFEQAIVGMNLGESKTITVSAAEAFGPYREELVRSVDRSVFPTDMEPEVGQRLNMSQGDGREFLVTVTDFSDVSVTLDANHPLAGEDLTFDIELVEVP